MKIVFSDDVKKIWDEFVDVQLMVLSYIQENI